MKENLKLTNNELLRLENVNMVFYRPGAVWDKERKIHVLKDVNLTIGKGEIVAVVGESGCGKTTIGKIITGLYRPASGSIYFEGKKISDTFGRNISSYSSVQFIQQDSYAALNPVRTIYQSLYAPIKTKKKKWSKKQIDERIEELMELVGLVPAEQFLTKYPHQLSGGQRQRILMARAVALDPQLIVADEPVSMIDVSLRLSIMNLMMSLNEKLGVSFVYITHDLSTARYIAQNGRIVVMYLGEIVEEGPIHALLSHPRHPYTRALVKAVPVPDPDANVDDALPLKSMELGSLEDRGEGCSFFDRCLYATERCRNRVEYVEREGVSIKCVNLDAVESGIISTKETIKQERETKGE